MDGKIRFTLTIVPNGNTIPWDLKLNNFMWLISIPYKQFDFNFKTAQGISNYLIKMYTYLLNEGNKSSIVTIAFT